MAVLLVDGLSTFAGEWSHWIYGTVFGKFLHLSSPLRLEALENPHRSHRSCACGLLFSLLPQRVVFLDGVVF